MNIFFVKKNKLKKVCFFYYFIFFERFISKFSFFKKVGYLWQKLFQKLI
ncbi:Hypothetical Protein SLY_0497 [Strawberry lethal yellows phytoplasma (CPA) str. NZSb11]|uniref:Uncharacterized protein n=1 Tax=Strawberry lethal yellows phytoplasma (CPA) str. NZSb11 TaxID=980422 RepID=R4RX11_PHYAS|nr:Hypothetical Protein SLY_0497 [Strawberry lethal yellows phytoplasma (CPA) str. NZSb11]